MACGSTLGGGGLGAPGASDAFAASSSASLGTAAISWSLELKRPRDSSGSPPKEVWTYIYICRRIYTIYISYIHIYTFDTYRYIYIHIPFIYIYLIHMVHMIIYIYDRRLKCLSIEAKSSLSPEAPRGSGSKPPGRGEGERP